MIILTATITRDDGDPIEITPQNALSMERSIFDRADTTMPSWGIISNGGSLRFVDVDGSIKNLAESQLLKSGMKVNIYLENTISTAKSSVGEFYTTKWDYDNNNREVSVNIKDKLQNWQNIIFKPILYNPNNAKDITGQFIYEQLYGFTPSEFKMIEFAKLDEDTQSHLQGFKVEHYIIKSDNLWSAWNVFCQSTFTRIYNNNNGETVCKFKRGN